MIRWQKIKERFCFPFRVFLSSEKARVLGLTPIGEGRVAIGRCRGLLLDSGCGPNELARHYTSGQGTTVGMDIHSWPGTGVVCEATSLPFPDEHFDTVLMLGCLNHLPLSKRIQV
jgi:hypothetical protein